MDSIKPFKKILVANRGEIACRVIRTAQQLGMRTVAVYSDADASALHVGQADEAVHIGPAASKDSYLQIDKIIEAAQRTGAEAIHPGYGFLSENADFAAACQQHGLTFIGPPVEAIKAMGSKSAAKQIMGEAGVPLLLGYHGDDQSIEVLKQAAADVGYPVLLKAVAGGGGKGMRAVNNEADFAEALATAQREARSSFGDDVMLVEKYLGRPRHVEVQVFCDSHGNGVYLFERDCSVQRRHQKVIEEAPAPGVSATLRQAMGEAAVTAAKAIHYEGAGTVEFLLNEDGTFYFMEMNTRLQVEHPVTECITGEDLVAWQLLVASGGKLPKSQAELEIRGHAFEARIYAEDPNNQFLPQTGVLDFYLEPSLSKHVRVDSGVTEGDEVSVHYDPMIAKLVSWDTDRDRALVRLNEALRSFCIAGVTTNIEFLSKVAEHEDFAAANLSTAFIAEHEQVLFESSESRIEVSTLAKIALYKAIQKSSAHNSDDPWASLNHWRLNAQSSYTQVIEVDDELHQVQVSKTPAGFSLNIDGEAFDGSGEIAGHDFQLTLNGIRSSAVVYLENEIGSWFADHTVRFSLPGPDLGIADDTGAAGDFRAPMNGTIVSVATKAGDLVEAGQTLVVMEAMKMEHAIHAPSDGKVLEVFYAEGALVDGGAPLLNFEAAADV